MQTLIYYTKTNAAAYNEAVLLKEALPHLPLPVTRAILRYRRLNDQLLAFSGKMLLLKALRSLQLHTQLSLNDLRYTSFHRPFFNYPVDFNISHSGAYALLAITDAGNIGVDIELKDTVDKQDFKSIFSQREWALINADAAKNQVFYKLWTRKEAVVKAAGRGLSIPLHTVDVYNDLSFIGNKPFYTAELAINKGYAACIATDFECSRKCIPHEVHLMDCVHECLSHQ